MTDETIRDEYSNLVIVIDEAHHLHIKESKKNAYSQIYRMLHLVKNCKVILMTGTPMVDSPSEIASLMNLILDFFQMIQYTTYRCSTIFEYKFT